MFLLSCAVVSIESSVMTLQLFPENEPFHRKNSQELYFNSSSYNLSFREVFFIEAIRGVKQNKAI